ncbi:hypothetical protein BY458DRAFT_529248 [Sporodiniella umbellata]|nr:hypothetical protein BY458DRAFT_529248 [Sporodiniella umbellata]
MFCYPLSLRVLVLHVTVMQIYVLLNDFHKTFIQLRWTNIFCFLQLIVFRLIYIYKEASNQVSDANQ